MPQKRTRSVRCPAAESNAFNVRPGTFRRRAFLFVLSFLRADAGEGDPRGNILERFIGSFSSERMSPI
jgi:hypothetical protein